MIRSITQVAVLVGVVALLAGCSGGPSGGSNPPGKPLQLRLVTSSVQGSCSAAALTSDGQASACDRDGTTTYGLSKSLGSLRPTSVVLSEDQGSANSIVLELDKADARTLGDASRQALGERLAILLDGRVLSAPQVDAVITSGRIAIECGSASEAKQVAAALAAHASS
jgi:preprotein translocase subunit SecD